MGKSVTAGTLKSYKPGWEKWQLYLKERGILDPYLPAYREEEKVKLLCNLFRIRYVTGKRGKAVYGIGAAIRKFYQINLQPVTFFDDPLTTGARTACRMSTDELRENYTLYSEQCAFRLEEPVVINGKSHFGFSASTTEFRKWVTLSNVTSCEIGTASHKPGAIASHNVKVIARRNDRESELLDDLFEYPQEIDP
jgi:hypothetical protein